MSIAHVGLVHLQDEPLFRITIRSKTQAYLREGLPIAMAVQGDARKLIEEAQAGIPCEPCDPEALLKTIVLMSQMSPDSLREMGNNGRTFYQRGNEFRRGDGTARRLSSSCQRLGTI